jgi:tetratricopeptide (TPR) repeat protein
VSAPPPGGHCPGTVPSAGWHRREWLLAALLVGLCLITFSPVVRCGFVDYDDPFYVNQRCRSGLSWANLSWACTTCYFGNWHPLVWLSLELDGQLVGPRPAGYHVTNLLLHTGSALLLFAALRRMTGDLWPSVLVAALFAVHPLNVEPVAWVSERKGVLSTLFWMLTIWAYARYAERPGISRYALVVLALALGLLAKPMLITLPLVLLLLDFWPLRRLGFEAGIGRRDGGRAGTVPVVRLVCEKLPLLAIAGVCGAIAVVAQSQAGALGGVEAYPWAGRLKNAAVSYVWYLFKVVCPTNLAAFYPDRGNDLPAWQALAAGALLVAVTLVVLRQARSAPYLLVGWLWYLGTLVPVIGLLVQIGAHGRADRYGYVPLVGVFIMLAWAAADVVARGARRLLVGGLAAVVLAALVVISWNQARTWQDSLTLWQHALQVTDGNYVAYNGAGGCLLSAGRDAEALEYFHEAVRLRPDYAAAHCGVGTVLVRQGNATEGLEHLREAVRIDPNVPSAHKNIGLACQRLGRTDEAITAFREALRADPSDSATRHRLGLALFRQGGVAEALEHLEAVASSEPENPAAVADLGLCCLAAGKWPEAGACFRYALALRPDCADFHRGLALSLHRQGAVEGARREFAVSLRLDPHWPEAALQSGWAMAADPDPSRRWGFMAALVAEQALHARGERDAEALDVLAAACAEGGRFAEAVEYAGRARALASESGASDLAREIGERLRLYEKGQPYRAAHPGSRS